MDIDRNQANQNNPMRRKIICFKCHGEGHIARNCTQGINFAEMTRDEIRAFFMDEDPGTVVNQEPIDISESSDRKDFG